MSPELRQFQAGTTLRVPTMRTCHENINQMYIGRANGALCGQGRSLRIDMAAYSSSESPCPCSSFLTLCPFLLAARTFENLDACEVLFSPSLATAASLLEVSANLSLSLSL